MRTWTSINKVIALIFSIVIIGLVIFSGCAGPQKPTAPPKPPAPPTPTYNVSLAVSPSTVSLAIDEKTKMPTPVITPIKFTGTGWMPQELIVIELVGAAKGGDLALATGNADAQGAFSINAEGLSVIQGVCGGKLVQMKPVFQPYTPIPAGRYTAKASGLQSGATASTSIEFTGP